MKQKKSDKKKKVSSGTDDPKKKRSTRVDHPSVLYLDDLPDVEVDENGVILTEGFTEDDFVLTWIDQGQDKADRWLTEISNGGRPGSILTPISKAPLKETQTQNKKPRLSKAKTPAVEKNQATKRRGDSSESPVTLDGGDGGVSRYGRQQKRKVNDDYVTAWQEKEAAPDEAEEVPQPPPSKQLKISQSPKKSPEKVKTPPVKQQKKTPAPSPAPTPENKEDQPLDAGDVVWARLGGFPFWPSVIVPDFKCNPPVAIRPAEQGSGKGQFHVMFLQDNGAHSWVIAKNVVRFVSPEVEDLRVALKSRKVYLSKSDKAFKVNPRYQDRWNKALEEAKQWYLKPAVERKDKYCPYYDEMMAEDDDEEITFKEPIEEEAELDKKKKSLPPEVSQEKPSIPKRKTQSLPGEVTNKPKPKKIKARQGLEITDSSSPTEEL